MKKIIALIALLMAACALSMPVMGFDNGAYENKINFSANITRGNIASDVVIKSPTPFMYNIRSYESVIVYNPFKKTVANYDGDGAFDGIKLKPGEETYVSVAEEIIFTDESGNYNVTDKVLNGNGHDRAGMFQLFYYPAEAPSLEIYAAAQLEAAKSLGNVAICEYGNGTFAGRPSRAWKMVNPSNGHFFITCIVRLNDHAIHVYVGEIKSYNQTEAKIQFWGL